MGMFPVVFSLYALESMNLCKKYKCRTMLMSSTILKVELVGLFLFVYMTFAFFSLSLFSLSFFLLAHITQFSYYIVVVTT